MPRDPVYRRLSVAERARGLLAVCLDQALHEFVDVARLGQVALVQLIAQLGLGQALVALAGLVVGVPGLLALGLAGLAGQLLLRLLGLLGLQLGGQVATVPGFPAEARAADAELAALAAADELARGSLEAAERYLDLAAQGSASVPAGRRGQLQVLLGVVRLLVARQRGKLPAVTDQAQRLQAMAEAPDAAREMAEPGLGEELRALALISLGTTEVWTAQFEEAQRHLEQGRTLALQIGRPFLEFSGLAHQAAIEGFRSSYSLAAERSLQAIELARRHGWTDEPAAGIAYVILAIVLTWRGQLDEAEPWIQRAERTVRPEAEPTAGLLVCYARGLLELARGHHADALAAFRAAERLAGLLAAPHLLVGRVRALQLQAMVRLGETERAERAIAELGEQERERGQSPGMVLRAQPLGRVPGMDRSLPMRRLGNPGIRSRYRARHDSDVGAESPFAA